MVYFLALLLSSATKDFFIALLWMPVSLVCYHSLPLAGERRTCQVLGTDCGSAGDVTIPRQSGIQVRVESNLKLFWFCNVRKSTASTQLDAKPMATWSRAFFPKPKPKPKYKLLWPITTDANSAMNQSELQAMHVTSAKRGKMHAGIQASHASAGLLLTDWLRNRREFC